MLCWTLAWQVVNQAGHRWALGSGKLKGLERMTSILPEDQYVPLGGHLNPAAGVGSGVLGPHGGKGRRF